MVDMENVIKGLNDIGGFIAGRLEFEHARNFLRTIDDALALLKEQEAVVRCMDCKKHDTYDCSITYLTTQKTPNDWFCADGIRKEAGT